MVRHRPHQQWIRRVGDDRHRPVHCANSGSPGFGYSADLDDPIELIAAAVEQRKTDGLTLDNRLVRIEQAVIAEASAERGVATLSLRFEADIAAVTRNAASEVVAGSLSDAVQTRDRWTFRRDVNSPNPNWVLIETDEDE